MSTTRKNQNWVLPFLTLFLILLMGIIISFSGEHFTANAKYLATTSPAALSKCILDKGDLKKYTKLELGTKAKQDTTVVSALEPQGTMEFSVKCFQ